MKGDKNIIFCRKLKHNHIVAFYGVVIDVENNQLSFLALVFELCNASLRNHIFKDKKSVPWETKSAAVITCQWGSDILDALKFIHSKKMVHRDLKLDNVLVSHFSYFLLVSSNRGRNHRPAFQCTVLPFLR